MIAPQPLPAFELLLVEPDFLLRRTVGGVVRSLALAQVQEAASLDHARRLLAERRFDALLVALDAEQQALQLLMDLRSGRLRSTAGMPVAVTAGAADAGLAVQLKALDVKRLLLKPFRGKDMVQTVRQLAEAR